MESMQKADCSTLMNNYKNVLTVISFITSIDLIGWYFDFWPVHLLVWLWPRSINLFDRYTGHISRNGRAKFDYCKCQPSQRIRRVCNPRRSTYMGQILLFYTHLKYFLLDTKSIIYHSLLKDCWLCVCIVYKMGIRLYNIG